MANKENTKKLENKTNNLSYHQEVHVGVVVDVCL